MLIAASGLALLISVSSVFAQVNTAEAHHTDEDQFWATKTNLSVGDIRAIRMAVGMNPDSRVSSIVNIDVHSLKQGQHILFVEGPCLKLHVLNHGPNGFVEIWSLKEIPRPFPGVPAIAPNNPGRGICQQAPQPPRVHVTSDERIVLEVPLLLDPFERTLPVATYEFRWNGSAYSLLDNGR